jgi:hypothetical protein
MAYDVARVMVGESPSSTRNCIPCRVINEYQKVISTGDKNFKVRGTSMAKFNPRAESAAHEHTIGEAHAILALDTSLM